jgi:hypothetical protein
MLRKTDRKMTVIFIFIAVIIAAIIGVIGFRLVGGYPTQTDIPSSPKVKASSPTVIAPRTTITVTTTVTKNLTKTQTTKPTISSTGTLTATSTITIVDTPVTASYLCNNDKCGTLMISLTCNPKILFRRVAILKIKNPNNETQRSAAVSAMGNNFADVLPDGSVNPVKINPGSYTLVLVNEKNVQVPQSRIISSMGSVSVTTGKITKYVFKEYCR